MPAAGPPPGLPKEWSCMGVVPKGCTTTLEVTWGSEVCKHRPAASPAPCPDPRYWGGTNPRSGADTATAGLGKQTPPTPCSVTRNGMLCKDKEPLWNHECGWAPRHQVCVTEEHPGGRGGSVRPRPAAEGTEPPAVRPAPAGGTGVGHADLGGSHEAGGEECLVPEVKSSGGEILRRGG